ncbi:MAG: FHA domain-containing protein [Anaerolineae bacterium]|nr:FHA domain-containing protein [Anaerolineae bacterium]
MSHGTLQARREDEFSSLSTTSVFPAAGYLRFEILGELKPLLVRLEDKVLVGRRDPSLIIQPDVDLSPYSGYRMGISRTHAQITRNAENLLALIDLGSANGTFLNGQRLKPHSPIRLRSGDEVNFGQMVVHVYYD